MVESSLAKKEIQYRKIVARTSVLILAPWNPLSLLCVHMGESHKEFKWSGGYHPFGFHFHLCYDNESTGSAGTRQRGCMSGRVNQDHLKR